jgi:hypothetical protein
MVFVDTLRIRKPDPDPETRKMFQFLPLYRTYRFRYHTDFYAIAIILFVHFLAYSFELFFWLEPFQGTQPCC